MRTRSRRALIGLLAAVVVGVAAPALALASNHLVKIREVYAGNTAHPGDEYVELQMYAAGQNFFNLGTTTTLYGPTGNVAATFSTPGDNSSNPPNGASQDRVLLASASAQTDFEVPAGYTLPAGDHLAGGGGAVCYTPTEGTGFADCVSWGDFTGTLPSSTGGNASPGGITDGMAISRSIARGCSTMLEPADDTNSAGDWSGVVPDPLSNAAAPPEQACPSATITKKPKAKTTDRTPTFKFKSNQNLATFECRVDKGTFTSCSSPFTARKLHTGKHTFQVRATNSGGGAGNPAKASFKVVSKQRRHHR